MPGVILPTLGGALLAIVGTVISGISLVFFLVISLITVSVGAFKALEIDFFVLTGVIIYLLFIRDRNRAANLVDKIINDSILSLPDELIEDIIDYLNQLDKLNLSTLNKRLHYQVKKRLLASIYVNNGGPKILLTNRFESVFYRKYTIISQNLFEKVIYSKDITLVKKVVFYSDSIPDDILQSLLRNNINLSFEHVVDNKLKYLTIFQRKKEPLWVTPDFPIENSITQLTVNYNGETISRSVLSKLKLDYLKALNITSDAFERSRDDYDPIEIKRLSFEFVDKQPSLAVISSTFQVDKIESLELRFKTRPMESEMIELMTKLTSLKHFAIMSQNMRFDRIVAPLAKDSLETFFVNVMGRYDTFLATIILDILKYQSSSIKRLCWSNKRLNVRLKSYGLDDFDRVYDIDATAKDLDIAEIKILVSNGFTNLIDVILNDSFYRVNRHQFDTVVQLIN